MRQKRTSTRGKRWKKGHSCVSNPDNTKYRDAAKGSFFQRIEGNSNLTQAALAEHNEVLRAGGGGGGEGGTQADDNGAMKEMEMKMDELSVDEDDLASAGRTFNTFATNFTSCTIPAFERFFRTFEPGSDQHTRMLAIHAAAQEYLTETKTPETATSYFCSLMVTLEAVKGTEEDVAAALSLMAKVARRVAIEVLRAKFGTFAATLGDTLDHHQNTGNSRLITNAIGSLSVLLRAQDRSQWSYASTQDLLQKLLGFAVHEKPKIRKSAQYNVSAIIRGSSFMMREDVETAERHPAAAAVAEFILTHLRTAMETGNTKTALHTLVFLRQVILTLPRKQLKTVCECLLSIMQVGRTLTNMCAMQALYALLSAHPPPEVLPMHTNAALICALSSRGGRGAGGVVVVPGKNDPQPATAWITLMTVALINLYKLSESEGLNELVLWFEELLPYWQSDHPSVRIKVCESFKSLLQKCVGQSDTAARGGQAASMFHVVEGGLSLQYQSAWGEVFRCLKTAFEVVGPKQLATVQPCLASLCQLMANPRLPHRAELEVAIGAAVTALGPQPLLAVAPVQATGEVAKDEANWWVLPLLRQYVRNTELSVFVAQLVPVASQCFTLLEDLKQKGQEDSVVGRAYQLVERQVWMALPSFCKGATDLQVVMSQEAFARLLCDHLKHRSDTRSAIMKAIKIMVSENLENPGRLALYAKNYLPALFNIYLTPQSKDGTSGGQRQNALITIRTYLQVVTPERAEELLGQVLTKHNETEGQDKLRRRALLDLARSLLPRLSGPPLTRLYQHVTPLLVVPDHGQQKAAYRLLEELLGTKTQAAQELVASQLDQLRQQLLEQLSSAAPSARPPRLRCMRLVLMQLSPQLEEQQCDAVMRQVVGEAVVCCGRSMSEATRKAAFLLISEVGATLQRLLDYSTEDTIKKGLELLLAGLVGSPTLASSTILAVIALMYLYKDSITEDVLHMMVQNTCVQLLCSSREIVASCLSFIKACLAIFPTPRLAPHVPPIMKALCNMTTDCQRKYRLKTRDILDRLMRKFGHDYITSLVPPGDTILHRRLKNLRKLNSRKQRKREAWRAREEEDFEEDEEAGLTPRALPASLDEILAEINSEGEDDKEEDEEKQKKKKKKASTWIKEDEEEIVDLLDASAGQAIVSGHVAKNAAGQRQGGNKGGDGGFAIDKETGKLIITEEDTKTKAQPPKMDFMEDIDEFLGIKSAAEEGKFRKRKRGDSIGSAELTMDEDAKSSKESTVQRPDQPTKKKKKKHDPGAEFRSKKAGGDMTKKGKVSPYAYVKFSKEQLNRRKSAKFAGQFGSLVRGARKGVAGAKKKGNKRRKK